MISIDIIRYCRKAMDEFLEMNKNPEWVVEKVVNDCEIKKMDNKSHLVLYRVDTTFPNHSVEIITDWLSDIDKRMQWDN